MAARRASTRRGHPEVSALRRARWKRNLTLEAVCAELDRRSPSGSSGITASTLSSWELHNRSTSFANRTVLAEFYRQPPEVLFADQDDQLADSREAATLLVGHHDLRTAMTEVVRGAQRYLAVVGSRSRDGAYLAAIEDVLAQRPELVHYRVLFGPPRHAVLKRHLLRLLEIRDPDDRSAGVKTLCLGINEDYVDAPERFLCASENNAVVPIPSLTSNEAFDSGVLLNAAAAERLIDHTRQCYASSRKVESREAIEDLPIQQPSPRDGGGPLESPL